MSLAIVILSWSAMMFHDHIVLRWRRPRGAADPLRGFWPRSVADMRFSAAVGLGLGFLPLAVTVLNAAHESSGWGRMHEEVWGSALLLVVAAAQGAVRHARMWFGARRLIREHADRGQG